MLLLTSTSDLVQVVTSATADIEVHASYVDHASGVITPGRTNTASITTATTTTVVAAPAASTQRNVKKLSLRNNHGSTTCDVTVTHTDGTNADTLIKVSLLAGELLYLDEKGEWHHLDVNGGEYPPSSIFASRGDMESGTATDKIVSPGRQHYHPGHPKAWVKCGVSGNMLASYNMTSVTDTGAGIATANINIDFTSADWCCQVTVERPNTTMTVTNLKFANIRSATQAAGAVGLECYDGTATTAVLEDPTAYHMVALGTQV
jgi:hypothetical protein